MKKIALLLLALAAFAFAFALDDGIVLTPLNYQSYTTLGASEIGTARYTGEVDDDGNRLQEYTLVERIDGFDERVVIQMNDGSSKSFIIDANALPEWDWLNKTDDITDDNGLGWNYALMYEFNPKSRNWTPRSQCGMAKVMWTEPTWSSVTWSNKTVKASGGTAKTRNDKCPARTYSISAFGNQPILYFPTNCMIACATSAQSTTAWKDLTKSQVIGPAYYIPKYRATNGVYTVSLEGWRNNIALGRTASADFNFTAAVTSCDFVFGYWDK